jgi:hypothetical protein
MQELNLEQVEAEIARAEEYLRVNGAEPVSTEVPDAEASDRPKISDERRREILAKLSDGRSQPIKQAPQAPPIPASHSTPIARTSPNLPASVVSRLSSAAASPASNNRYSTQDQRDQLIKRLLDERRQKLKDKMDGGSPAPASPRKIDLTEHRTASLQDQPPAINENKLDGDPANYNYGDGVFFASDLSPAPPAPAEAEAAAAERYYYADEQQPKEETKEEEEGEDDTAASIAAARDAVASLGIQLSAQDAVASLDAQLLQQEMHDGLPTNMPHDIPHASPPVHQRTAPRPEATLSAQQQDRESTLLPSSEDRPRRQQPYHKQHPPQPPPQQQQKQQQQQQQQKKKQQQQQQQQSGNRLYDQARASSKSGIPRARQEAAAREAEAKLMEECTFQPKINKWVGSIAPVTGEERIEQLSRPREQEYVDRERRKMQQELSEIEGCTFRPQIRKSTGSKTKGSGGSAAVSDRLHHEADQRTEAREQARRRLEAAELGQYSFKPEINPETNAILDMSRYRPIHERLGEMQRAKSSALQHARVQYERNNPDLTFAPQINAKSNKIAAERRSLHDMTNADGGSLDVAERLNREAEYQAKRKLHRMDEHEAEKARNCTFAPQISEQSARLVASKSEFQHADFLERQEALEEEGRVKAAKGLGAMQQLDEDAQCTFHPNVGNAGRVLEHTRPARVDENEQDRIERLFKQDQHDSEQLREQISDDYYAQFSYRPKINKISRVLGRAASVDELVADERCKQSKARAAAKQEAAEKQSCPFKPKTNKWKGKQSVGKASRIDINKPEMITANIAAARHDRDAKLAQTRRDQEYEELKSCTFTPQINEGKPEEPTGPIVVRGLGRYLELKEMARRKEQDKKEREHKAFSVRYTPRTYTVPEPFNLTASRAGDKRRAVAKEREETAMKECTFRPKTMERANREMIQTLLHDDGDDEGAADDAQRLSSSGGRKKANARAGVSASARVAKTGTYAVYATSSAARTGYSRST